MLGNNMLPISVGENTDMNSISNELFPLHYKGPSLYPYEQGIPVSVSSVVTYNKYVPEHPAFCWMTTGLLTNYAGSMTTNLRFMVNGMYTTSFAHGAGQSGRAASAPVTFGLPFMTIRGENRISFFIPNYSTQTYGTDKNGNVGMFVDNAKLNILSSKIDKEFGFMSDTPTYTDVSTTDSPFSLASMNIVGGYRYLILASINKIAPSSSEGTVATHPHKKVSIQIDGVDAKNIVKLYGAETHWADVSVNCPSLIIPLITDVIEVDSSITLVAEKTGAVTTTRYLRPSLFAAPFNSNNVDIDTTEYVFGSTVDTWYTNYSKTFEVSKDSRILVVVEAYCLNSTAKYLHNVRIDGVLVGAMIRSSKSGTSFQYTADLSLSDILNSGQHTVTVDTIRYDGSSSLSTYKVSLLEIKN